MRARTRKGRYRRKKRVAGSSDNVLHRALRLQETAYLQRVIDGLDEELAQCQDRYNALNQEKMEADFHAYNSTILKELYAMALVDAGIPLPEPPN